MTVCVAAFAEKSKAIVMVSDKAVTYSGTAPMQWDTSVRKVRRIGKTFWYALLAGDPTFALDTISTCEAILSSNSDKDLGRSALGMQRCMKLAYQRCRKQMVMDQVLAPRLLTPELLVARRADLQPLDPGFLAEMSEKASSLQTRCSILVCGFDEDDAPTIFAVSNPGKVGIYNLTGFHAVGVGSSVALARLLVLEADQRDSLSLAL